MKQLNCKTRTILAMAAKRREDKMQIRTQYHRALAACRPLALFTIMTLAPALATAQQLSPLFGNSAGAIKSVAAVQVAQDQFVTAVINGGGHLEVIAWRANLRTNRLARENSSVAGKVISSAGEAGAIAISSPYALDAGVSGAFTTAMVNVHGYLDISYWEVSTSGAISLISEIQGDAAFYGSPDVSVTSVYNAKGYPSFMTAMSNSAGDLEVSLWSLNSSNQIQLGSTAYAGAIGGVSIACLHDSNYEVVTAVQDGGGYLELIQWLYGTGTVVRGSSTYTSTPADNISVISGIVDFGGSSFSNAFYTGLVDPSNGAAYFSAWNQDLDVQITGGPYEVTPWNVLAARQTTLIMADTPPNGGGAYYLRVFDQLGNGIVTGSYGEYASVYSIAMVDISSFDYVTFAVAYRNSAGDLQIQVWQYVLACSPNCEG
jgi:hypothetical protein